LNKKNKLLILTAHATRTNLDVYERSNK